MSAETILYVMLYLAGVAGAFVIGTYCGGWAMARRANRYMAKRMGNGPAS